MQSGSPRGRPGGQLSPSAAVRSSKDGTSQGQIRRPDSTATTPTPDFSCPDKSFNVSPPASAPGSPKQLASFSASCSLRPPPHPASSSHIPASSPAPVSSPRHRALSSPTHPSPRPSPLFSNAPLESRISPPLLHPRPHQIPMQLVSGPLASPPGSPSKNLLNRFPAHVSALTPQTPPVPARSASPGSFNKPFTSGKRFRNATTQYPERRKPTLSDTGV